jgi:hypothetical protein
MIDKISQYGRGIALWIRYGPSRVVAALAGHTRLPEGFWVVLGLSATVGAVAASAAVVLVYRIVTRSEGPKYVDSDSS